MPKFLLHDLPLFENIISDLFPETKRLVVDYKDLNTAIQKASEKKNLQPVKPFVDKVF